MYKPKPTIITTQSGYQNVQSAQRKYFKDRRKKMPCKGKKKSLAGMSQHLVVNCNEAMRKQSQDKSAMRGGEKKNIKGGF